MGKKEILVVDDEWIIKEVLATAFRKEGYIVHSAECAEVALEIMKNEDIQVIFLDLNLQGVNGVELGKLIRKDFPKVIIYALTGYESLFDIADCREAGFDGYFTKLVKMEKLCKVAKDAFNKIEGSYRF
jgi:CheY-like chemotaxis protein